MDQALFSKLKESSDKYMSQDRLYHDVSHINNVIKNARLLIDKVGGDELVILTALLFHDIRRDVDDHEKIGADETREILKNIKEFPSEKVEEICLAIECHEKGQVTHNEKVVSDADKIDAFNIVGLGRGFMMLAKKGFTLKNGIDTYLELLDKWYEEFHFEESRKIVEEDRRRIRNLLLEMQCKQTSDKN